MSTSSWELAGTVALGTCWAAFGLAWAAGFVVNLRSGPPVVRRNSRRMAWIVLLALIVVVRFLIPVGVWRPLTYRSGWLDALGIVVLLAGTVFTLWARWRLGKMWTGTVTIKKDHQLRTGGPYAVTRHPIYTGLLTMLAGTAMISGGGPWPAFLVFAYAAMMMKIRSEERLLSDEFPESYPAFKAAVPRLIPGLRRQSVGLLRFCRSVYSRIRLG